MWLKELKLALINEDVKELDRLTASIPTLSSIEELETSLYLLTQAIEIIRKKRDNTSEIMRNLKKSKKFLEHHRIANIHKYFDKNS